MIDPMDLQHERKPKGPIFDLDCLRPTDQSAVFVCSSIVLISMICFVGIGTFHSHSPASPRQRASDPGLEI